MTDKIIGAFIALAGIVFNTLYTNKTMRKASVEQYRANVISRESIAWISKTREIGDSFLLNLAIALSNLPMLVQEKIDWEENGKPILDNGKDLGNGTKGLSEVDGNKIKAVQKSYQKATQEFDNSSLATFKDATSLSLFLSSHGYSNSDALKCLEKIKIKMKEIGKQTQQYKNDKQYANELLKLSNDLSALRDQFEKLIVVILEKEWQQLSK